MTFLETQICDDMRKIERNKLTNNLTMDRFVDNGINDT
jgi:hypothetical protein